jgi:hypothetical protein
VQLHRDQVGYLEDLRHHERLLQPNSNVLLGAGVLEGYGLALGDVFTNLGRLYQADPTTLAELTGTDFLLVPARPMQRWVADGLRARRLAVVTPLPSDGAVVLRPTHPLPRAFLVDGGVRVVDGEWPLLQQGAYRDGVVLRRGPLIPTEAEAGGEGELRPVVPAAWSPAAVRFQLQPGAARDHTVLVVNDAYADGWHAAVDGREVPIFRANLLARAVPLSAGARTVELWFDVPVFDWSARARWLGLLAALLALLFHQRRRRE